MRRRTKIVATLGPACSQPQILRDMLADGVDVLRVNFSHADKQTLETVQLAKTIASELGKPLSILADLQGPKLRIGRFEQQQISLKDGQDFILDCATEAPGNEQFVGVAYHNLCYEVQAGDVLLLDDGMIEMRVMSVCPPQIHCRVTEGGVLKNNKGLNRRGGGLAAAALTDKDREDLKVAAAIPADYITLSFVKNKEDIEEVRALLRAMNAPDIPVIAKIERTEALQHLNEIIRAADAVMVARGDLGVEIGAAEVPAVQKRIIEQGRRQDKIIITATQMMETMIHNPQPTRAEVSDVANAILDGTDAVMLSAETASGRYPVKVVAMMDKICISAEKHAAFYYHNDQEACHYYRADRAIAMATMHAANHFPIKAIVALTESGATAIWMSRQQSSVPIYAITANEHSVGRLCLVNNVFPILLNYRGVDREQLNEWVIQALKQQGLLSGKGHVLLTRGSLIGQPGGTNSMEIIAFCN